MFKSRTNTSDQVFDAFSLNADIFPIGGSVRQMYYTVEKTYEDDRKWVPCILNGRVYINDPANIMTGEVGLTDIEWYTSMPIEGDYATGRITNPAASVLEDVDVYDEETGELTHEAAWRSVDFLISDGSNAAWCSDVPKNCLIVHKNVPQLTGMPIFAVLKFLDQRIGTTKRITRNIEFSTELYKTEITLMKGDSGDEILLDPLSFTDTIPEGQTILDIPWTRTVNAQLIGVEGNVPDNEACYLWVTEDSSTVTGWREFTEDEIEAMQLTGVKTKTLSLDARMIHSKLRLRCYGCRREADAAWQSPLAEINPFYTMQFTMTFNDTLHADPIQLTGNKQNTKMDITASYEMNISYNNKPVADNRRCLFQIHWKAQNMQTGTIYDMGVSPTLSFVPKSRGFTLTAGFIVWAEVSIYAGCSIVIDNGQKVMQGEYQVISPTFN